MYGGDGRIINHLVLLSREAADLFQWQKRRFKNLISAAKASGLEKPGYESRSRLPKSTWRQFGSANKQSETLSSMSVCFHKYQQQFEEYLIYKWTTEKLIMLHELFETSLCMFCCCFFFLTPGLPLFIHCNYSSIVTVLMKLNAAAVLHDGASCKTFQRQISILQGGNKPGVWHSDGSQPNSPF